MKPDSSRFVASTNLSTDGGTQRSLERRRLRRYDINGRSYRSRRRRDLTAKKACTYHDNMLRVAQCVMKR
jgi:hypothetical protein